MALFKRKISIIVLLTLLSIIASLAVVNVSATELDNRENHIGFGINVAKATEISQDVVRERIFEKSWLDHFDQQPTKLNGSSGYYDSWEGLDEEELLNNLKLDTDYGTGVTGYDGPFSLSVSQNIGISMNLDYETYNSVYFNKISYMHKLNGYRWDDCYSNTSKYANYSNFSAGFKSELSKLETGGVTESEIDSFFQKFGTHMICKAYYGGRADIYTSVVSNDLNFDTTVRSSISSYFSGDYMSMISGNTSISLNYQKMTGVSNSHVSSKISLSYAGGEAFNATDVHGVRDGINSWKQTISDSAVNYNADLVDFGSDSLLPLWEIIREFNPNLANTIEDYYNRKADSSGITSGYLEKYYNDTLSQIDVKSPYKSNVIRVVDRTTSSAIKVTDSGWQDDQTIYWSQLNIDIDSLKSNGYKSIKFYTEVYMKEEHAGYQYVGINNGNKVVRHERREYGGGGFAHTKWGWQEFNEAELVNINDMNSNYFIFQFKADGTWGDDWYFSDVEVKVEFVKY